MKDVRSESLKIDSLLLVSKMSELAQHPLVRADTPKISKNPKFAPKSADI